jgi:hypothetical protein
MVSLQISLDTPKTVLANPLSAHVTILIIANTYLTYIGRRMDFELDLSMYANPIGGYVPDFRKTRLLKETQVVVGDAISSHQTSIHSR